MDPKLGLVCECALLSVYARAFCSKTGSKTVVFVWPVSAANTRLPFGHPEAFIEAFANVYLGAADAIADEVEGNYKGAANYDFPTVDDGVEGMAFIEAAVASSKNNSAWNKLDC